MKMHQFQWFFPFFVKSFQITIHKKFIKESFMNLSFVTPDGRGIKEIFHHSHESLCHSSFWELSIIRKCFSWRAKITEISALSENCFFGNKTQVISKGYWMTSEAYFIKWTTSGEPPVCLKDPFCSNFRRNKQ